MLALLILSLALAMDAFAASLCQGAVAGDARGTAVRVGSAFGAAQGLMPLIGWSLSVSFAAVVHAVDHWIALALLGLLGGKMLWEGFAKGADWSAVPMGPWAFFVASIGTSVDAAAAGVTLPLLGQPIVVACAVIGGTTAALCFAGVWHRSTAGQTGGAVRRRRADRSGRENLRPASVPRRLSASARAFGAGSWRISYLPAALLSAREK